jgi:hypothetical protein
MPATIFQSAPIGTPSFTHDLFAGEKNKFSHIKKNLSVENRLVYGVVNQSRNPEYLSRCVSRFFSVYFVRRREPHCS